MPMSIFDKTYKSTLVSYSPRNEQEAWIAVMHACIAVDEEVADAELEELAQTLACKDLFEDHEVRDYYRAVLLAHAQIGSKRLIDNSVEQVSTLNKPALFELTIQLVLADGIVAEKEEELIHYLYSALDLEEDIAKNIVSKVLAQHKNNSSEC